MFSTSNALHVLGLTVCMASFTFAPACSRNANQTNLLGAACRDQSECPSDLTCRDGFCRAYCSAAGACTASGEVCVNGACVPLSSVPGGNPNGGGPNDPNNPLGPGQQTSPGEDGTVVRDDLMITQEAIDFAVTGDRVFYFSRIDNGFGGRDVKMMSAKLDSSDPPVEVAGVTTQTNFTAHGGHVYWVHPGATLELRRAPAGGGAPETLVSNFGFSGGGSSLRPIRIFGTKVPFVDQNYELHIYDLQTDTSDSVAYGQIDPSLVTIAGTTLYAVAFPENSGDPWVIKKATLGEALTNAGQTFPNSAEPSPFAVMGGSLCFGFKGNPSRIVKVDPSGAQPIKDLYTTSTNGYEPTMAFDDTSAYVYDTSKQRVVRIDVANETVTDATGPTSYANAIRVSEGNLYWVSYDPTHGNDRFKITKKAITK